MWSQKVLVDGRLDPPPPPGGLKKKPAWQIFDFFGTLCSPSSNYSFHYNPSPKPKHRSPGRRRPFFQSIDLGFRPRDCAVAATLGDQQDVAICGMGCRFPGSDTPAAFWRLLQAKGSGRSNNSSSRFKSQFIKSIF
jgi:hypothetical protein